MYGKPEPVVAARDVWGPTGPGGPRGPRFSPGVTGTSAMPGGSALRTPMTSAAVRSSKDCEIRSLVSGPFWTALRPRTDSRPTNVDIRFEPDTSPDCALAFVATLSAVISTRPPGPAT